MSEQPPERDNAAPDASKSEEFVVVAEEFNEIQMQFIKAALEEAGIPYSFTGEELATVKFCWPLDAKLRVPAPDADRAARIVQAALAGPELPEDAEDDGAPPEPERSE
jgi:hypothetical protein